MDSIWPLSDGVAEYSKDALLYGIELKLFDALTEHHAMKAYCGVEV